MFLNTGKIFSDDKCSRHTPFKENNTEAYPEPMPPYSSRESAISDVKASKDNRIPTRDNI